ncbi:VOC family protein [Edaphobacter aggregans]|uniref:VOC family protein n=1 Tax=Edaphobacter aggregans TaxID=570835 RepID=UPI000557809D|nr:VOC family protein [Edaphobacter aggregans]
MAQPFVHLELNTPDLAKAKDFYGSLVGWTFQDMDMGPGGTYSVFKPASGPGGGIFTVPGAPTAWLPYIGVDDLKAATDKAESLGAKIIMREQPVPDMGAFSILTDPTGANIALWQPKSA